MRLAEVGAVDTNLKKSEMNPETVEEGETHQVSMETIQRAEKLKNDGNQYLKGTVRFKLHCIAFSLM